MASAEVKVVNSLVGLQVVIVERDVVETDTGIYLQVIENVPLVLQVETELVKAYL